MASLTRCRSCNSSSVVPVLSLGCVPLANGLLAQHQLAEREETYPLEVFLCQACTLVQLGETVEPQKLFREYHYRSSFSDTMLEHSRRLVETVITRQGLNASSLVLEIGSNDGYLLQHYKRAGIPVLGIEPAENIAQVAREKNNIPTISDFFSTEVAEEVLRTHGSADVIHGHNVLAHIPDLHGVLRGCVRLLKPGGVVVVEVPYVKEMVDQGYFDTIYHEHVFYFSLTALDRLFDSHELIIHDLERFSIHGGTLRIFASRVSDKGSRSEAVLDLLGEEKASGLHTPAYYLSFSAKIASMQRDLVGLLRRFKAAGKRIAVYGASAKGSTLLNYFGLGKETLEYVVDRNPAKQGLFTPGSHLPIYSTEKLVEDIPDYALLLTWNFADEIVRQQSDYRRLGGKFIIPLPEVHIV